jgi:hypothetical protein
MLWVEISRPSGTLCGERRFPGAEAPVYFQLSLRDNGLEIFDGFTTTLNDAVMAEHPFCDEIIGELNWDWS